LILSRVSVFVAVNRVRRKSEQANRDVFRSLGSRRAVPHPFTGVDDDSLARRNFTDAVTSFDLQLTFQHYGLIAIC